MYQDAVHSGELKKSQLINFCQKELISLSTKVSNNHRFGTSYKIDILKFYRIKYILNILTYNKDSCNQDELYSNLFSFLRTI